MRHASGLLVVGVAVGLVAGYSLGHGIDPDEKHAPAPSAPLPASPAPSAASSPSALAPTALPAPGDLAVAPAPLAGAAGAPLAAAAPASSGTPATAAAAAPRPSVDADLDSALRSKDPKRIIAYVRDLAHGGRAAWPLAAKALIDLARSIEDDNRLGINVTEFYKAARQDAFAPLYVDAIANPQAYDAAFRSFSVRELPWTNQEDVGLLLAKQLAGEKDPRVAHELAGSLAERPDPAQLADLEMAARTQTDARVRWSIIQAIDATPGDDALRALQALAASETNKSVKGEIDLAVKTRTAPVSGYLITDVVPDGQAAKVGVRAGDILATYGGMAIDSNEALFKAKDGTPRGQPVVLGLVRDGQTLTVTIAGGTIGIDGRYVKPRS